MNELIEKLKHNKTAFGLLEPEEQECLRAINRNGCIYYGSKGWADKVADDTFANLQIYAIKPDYKPEPDVCQYCGAARIVRPSGEWQFHCKCYDPDERPKPEPEFVDCEVFENIDRLWVEHGGIKHKLFELLAMPKFEGFFLKGSGDVEVRPEWVARHHPNVIARLRKP